jgi:hypothetical protein
MQNENEGRVVGRYHLASLCGSGAIREALAARHVSEEIRVVAETAQGGSEVEVWIEFVNMTGNQDDALMDFRIVSYGETGGWKMFNYCPALFVELATLSRAAEQTPLTVEAIVGVLRKCGFLEEGEEGGGVPAAEPAAPPVAEKPPAPIHTTSFRKPEGERLRYDVSWRATDNLEEVPMRVASFTAKGDAWRYAQDLARRPLTTHVYVIEKVRAR